ncbi:hypothetical protein [Hyphomicrobium sp.]|uniref:hypothetical protein n=1 Tax=Hyphomicrobium sp. TaxID=82 RepID=UPI002E3324F4|nr:hypothetical protein [Hyphomicrobium sp.]HEX2841412.1 hypothetical protein [Hyphomicrobium sp.]
MLTSVSYALVAVHATYVIRSVWIARKELRDCAWDTKVLYLIVAPVLTLAVDLLEATDRLFWAPAQRPATGSVSKRSHRGRTGSPQLKPT